MDFQFRSDVADFISQYPVSIFILFEKHTVPDTAI